MKIITILGSPRKKGNTAAVLKAFEELVMVQHEVERINIADISIQGCLGCDACQRTLDESGCVRQDDFNEVITGIRLADLVVYASPVYVWDFPSQMKALMDRHYCLVKWEDPADTRCLLEGKHVMLLATCGGSAEENGDLIQEVFRREMEYLHCRILGKYIAPFCITPSDLGDQARQIAQQMAADMLKL